MTQQAFLFDTFTVHCFFGWCSHTETDADPYGDRHDRMEAHYRSSHAADIARLIQGSICVKGRLAR